MQYHKGKSIKMTIHLHYFIPPNWVPFNDPCKTFPSCWLKNMGSLACLSDLFRHGIRNKASERPSGRKPKEEAHSSKLGRCQNLSSDEMFPDILTPTFFWHIKQQKLWKKLYLFSFYTNDSNDSIIWSLKFNF